MDEHAQKAKPCPHCGSPDTYLAIRGDRHGFSVLCESCGLTGPSNSVQEHALAAWNCLYVRKPQQRKWWFLRLFEG